MAAGRMAVTGVHLLKKIVEQRTKSKNFENVFKNFRVLSGGDGSCVCEVTVTEDLQNRVGTLHGGALMTLVDAVSTMALMTTERQVSGVSVNLNISFLKPANVGEDVIIDAQTHRIGKTLAFLTVDVRNQAGTLLAHGQHTKYIST